MCSLHVTRRFIDTANERCSLEHILDLTPAVEKKTKALFVIRLSLNLSLYFFQLRSSSVQFLKRKGFEVCAFFIRRHFFRDAVGNSVQVAVLPFKRLHIDSASMQFAAHPRPNPHC